MVYRDESLHDAYRRFSFQVYFKGLNNEHLNGLSKFQCKENTKGENPYTLE